MAASSRRKGVTGEAEVRRILERAGYTVRGLEGQGDWLAFRPGWPTLHVETKRAERLKLPEWLRQTAAEAPAGTLPVLVFRQNRGGWYITIPLAEVMVALS